MLDWNVLLRQKRDEVPEGTLSCPDRNMEIFHHYRHYEGLRLLPSVCDQKLIQQTLSRSKIINGIFFQTGFPNPNVSGHVDIVYRRSTYGHYYPDSNLTTTLWH